MNKKLIRDILMNLPKTLYINFRLFNLRTACKLPIIISNKTRLEGINKDTVKIDSNNIGTGMILIGIDDGSAGLMTKKLNNYFGTDGISQIVFKGYANISKGCCLKSINGGILSIGNSVYLNYNCKIFCKKEIILQDNILMGWNCVINDGDGHSIFEVGTDKKLNDNKSIFIGNNVWIGASATLLKGSYINDNCIVGYGSIVTKKFNNKNAIIGGYPSKVLKENVYWK